MGEGANVRCCDCYHNESHGSEEKNPTPTPLVQLRGRRGGNLAHYDENEKVGCSEQAAGIQKMRIHCMFFAALNLIDSDRAYFAMPTHSSHSCEMGEVFSHVISDRRISHQHVRTPPLLTVVKLIDYGWETSELLQPP